ncbi:MAG: hypothetical protein EON54_14415, partial [Alcaligenaceae bacterium]
MSSVFQFDDTAVKFMDADLAKSGLVADDLGAQAVRGIGNVAWPTVEIVDAEGHKEKQNLSAWIAGHYVIPYWTPEGFRIEDAGVRKPKFKDGAPSEVTRMKYARPSKFIAGANALIPYMHPGRLDHDVLVLDIHEGEKKTACAVKHGQCAIGIAGCGRS